MTFPFAAEIDKAAGMTGSLPNRVQNRATGLWFVLVPGGEYEIGDNQLEDSAKIKVKLSPYYIAEREVTNGMIARYHLEQFEAMKSPELEAGEPKPTDDELLAFRVIALDFYTVAWPFDIKLDAEVVQQKETFERRITDEALPTKDGESAPLRFSEESRKLAENVLTRAVESIRKLEDRGDRRYGMANFANAEAIARWAAVRLPTEAEWETAAQLLDQRKLTTVVDMLDSDVLEWCSDCYAHDYFRRTTELTDPKGPRRGRFSAAQIKAETPESSLGIGTRLAARNRGVIRGGGVSKRSHASRSYGTFFSQDTSGVAKGIRPAFTAPTKDRD